MVWEDLKPRDVMTPGAFRNAAAAVLAVSGSINCVKHLQAVAVEAGVDLDVFGLFNELGAQGAGAERGGAQRPAYDRSVRRPRAARERSSRRCRRSSSSTPAR
jgi:hypothetical protein